MEDSSRFYQICVIKKKKICVIYQKYVEEDRLLTPNVLDLNMMFLF